MHIVILIWICREYSDYGALYQSQRDLLRERKELRGRQGLRKSRRYCSCRLIIWTSERPLGHLTRELSDKIVHLTEELSDKSRLNSGARG